MGLKLMDREAGSRVTWLSARLSARPWGEQRTRRTRLGAAVVAAAVAARFSICSSKHHIKTCCWDFVCNCHCQSSVVLDLHADHSTYGATGTCILAAGYATAYRAGMLSAHDYPQEVSLQIIAILRTSSSTPACLLLQMH